MHKLQWGRKLRGRVYAASLAVDQSIALVPSKQAAVVVALMIAVRAKVDSIYLNPPYEASWKEISGDDFIRVNKIAEVWEKVYLYEAAVNEIWNY